MSSPPTNYHLPGVLLIPGYFIATPGFTEGRPTNDENNDATEIINFNKNYFPPWQRPTYYDWFDQTCLCAIDRIYCWKYQINIRSSEPEYQHQQHWAENRNTSIINWSSCWEDLQCKDSQRGRDHTDTEGSQGVKINFRKNKNNLSSWDVERELTVWTSCCLRN